MPWSVLPEFAGEARRIWRESRAAHLAAGLAYFALFSLVPLLALGLAAAVEIFGEQTAHATLARLLQNLLGAQAGGVVENSLREVRPFSTTALGTGVSLAVLIWGAHLVFSQLKASLNVIWGVIPKRNPVAHFLLVRLVSLALVSAFVAQIIGLVALTTWLSALARRAPQILPAPALLLQGVDFAVSFVFTLFLLALIYKFLPDTRVSWADVWMGASWTALLLAAGKALLAAYLTRVNFSSVYGAVVSLLVLLIALFFYAQIFLFGAVLTAAKHAMRAVAGELTAEVDSD